tara:strand:- start:151 stop:321 length:171 start_codon:yes stop_codon:yes gene_type:complete
MAVAGWEEWQLLVSKCGKVVVHVFFSHTPLQITEKSHKKSEMILPHKRAKYKAQQE